MAAGFEPAEGCPSRAFEARSLGPLRHATAGETTQRWDRAVEVTRAQMIVRV